MNKRKKMLNRKIKKIIKICRITRKELERQRARVSYFFHKFDLVYVIKIIRNYVHAIAYGRILIELYFPFK